MGQRGGGEDETISKSYFPKTNFENYYNKKEMGKNQNIPNPFKILGAPVFQSHF